MSIRARGKDRWQVKVYRGRDDQGREGWEYRLGHTTPTLTLNTYAHLVSAADRAAAEHFATHLKYFSAICNRTAL